MPRPDPRSPLKLVTWVAPKAEMTRIAALFAEGTPTGPALAEMSNADFRRALGESVPAAPRSPAFSPPRLPPQNTKQLSEMTDDELHGAFRESALAVRGSSPWAVQARAGRLLDQASSGR